MLRNLMTCLAVILTTGALSRPAAADVRVVTTVPDLAALAQAVGGGNVEVRSLALPTQDPHFVDAKPSLALALNKADLLIAVGLGLEVGWLPTLQTGARNSKILSGGSGYLDCSTVIDPLEVPTQPIDRSMGDIHPGGNPHYLYDPRRARVCAAAIARVLAEIDPGNAEAYKANLRAFEGQLKRRLASWKKTLGPHRGAPIIAYHKSWAYLVDWLGLRVIDHLEPKPGIAPTPRHVVRVIQRAKKAGVKIVLQESYYPSKTGQLVASKLGGRVVALSGGADLGKKQSYLERMDELVAKLARALGGR